MRSARASIHSSPQGQGSPIDSGAGRPNPSASGCEVMIMVRKNSCASTVETFYLDNVNISYQSTSTQLVLVKAGYRYGFNGQEKDNEVIGEGNSYTAEYWNYDARLGRRWNVDPKPNPSISNYAVFQCSPLILSDLKGDTIEFPNATTEFGWNFQLDMNKLYEGNYGRALIRYLHSSTVLIRPSDAGRWYLSDEGDVLNSKTKGDYPRYQEAKDGLIEVQYAQRFNVCVAGISAISYLILAHEFVHARDIASGFFTEIYERAKSGNIKLPELDFENELGEVRV